jgi:hypothetical protein
LKLITFTQTKLIFSIWSLSLFLTSSIHCFYILICLKSFDL